MISYESEKEDMIDYNLFAKMMDIDIDSKDTSNVNICGDCGINMQYTQNAAFICPNCGSTKNCDGEYYDAAESTKINTRSVQISNGKGTFTMHSGGDYSKTQQKNITAILRNRENRYNDGIKIPRKIINIVRDKYNDLQRLTLENKNGGQKKFVRRADVKNEILATLLYYTCIEEKIPRCEKDVAVFMRLDTEGISRGKNIVRTLSLNGHLDINDRHPIDEIANDYIIRYLETLQIDMKYAEFIKDMLLRSNTKRAGISCTTKTKIVGTMWFLNDKCNMGIKQKTFENACDNIRANTFTKYSKQIEKNIEIFIPVLKHHGVGVNLPHGYEIHCVY